MAHTSTALKRHLLAPAVLMLSMPLSGSVLAQVAQDSRTKDPVEMEVNLRDVVKFNWGFQGATQGAGTPNQVGIGGFLPISVGDNSVWFLDALANVNFADYGNDSSIINTKVAGTTISTSSRLGYRWLNSDRSWMYGVNGGYDSRPMNTGGTDTGVNVSGTEKSAFFKQVAVNAEAVSDSWNFNAYALVPVGDTEQRLNRSYLGGAVDTYGLDVGYAITPEWDAVIGYYYQNGDLRAAESSGGQVELAYQIADGSTAGINVSYDEAFETRVSANIEYRFGSNIAAAETKKKAWQKPTIQALSEAVKHRNIRVNDVAGKIRPNMDGYGVCKKQVQNKKGMKVNVENAPIGTDKVTMNGKDFGTIYVTLTGLTETLDGKVVCVRSRGGTETRDGSKWHGNGSAITRCMDPNLDKFRFTAPTYAENGDPGGREGVFCTPMPKDNNSCSFLQDVFYCTGAGVNPKTPKGAAGIIDIFRVVKDL